MTNLDRTKLLGFRLGGGARSRGAKLGVKSQRIGAKLGEEKGLRSGSAPS